MAVENLPRWNILPNWRVPVSERLEWLTPVLVSDEGAEQRFSLRWSPRRTLEVLMTVDGPSRTLFDLAVGAAGAADWYIPYWPDRVTLTEDLGIGVTTLNVDTVDRDFVAGGFAFLRSSDFDSEVLEIASITDTSITFVDGPEREWPAGTDIFPAFKARLDQQPEMQRFGSRALENPVRFIVVGANDRAATFGGDTYLDLPVLVVSANEIQNIMHGYARLIEDADNQVGLIERVDTAGLGLTTQMHNWLAVGREERSALRAYFYALAGRCLPTWVPTFAEDLMLVAPSADGASSIEVLRCGFTEYGGPRENRQDVQFVLRDGTRFYGRISGSALTDSGTEIITLESALPFAVSPETVERISFMTLSRLDTDAIEFSHLTDTVAQVNASFRSAPAIRTADDYDLPDFPSPFMSPVACGAPPPPWTVVDGAGGFVLEDTINPPYPFEVVLPWNRQAGDVVIFAYFAITDTASGVLIPEGWTEIANTGFGVNQYYETFDKHYITPGNLIACYRVLDGTEDQTVTFSRTAGFIGSPDQYGAMWAAYRRPTGLVGGPPRLTGMTVGDTSGVNQTIAGPPVESSMSLAVVLHAIDPGNILDLNTDVPIYASGQPLTAAGDGSGLGEGNTVTYDKWRVALGYSSLGIHGDRYTRDWIRQYAAVVSPGAMGSIDIPISQLDLGHVGRTAVLVFAPS